MNQSKRELSRLWLAAAPHPPKLIHVLLGGVLVGDAERRADPEVVDRVY
jgi:hypothetical protein